MSDRGKTSFVRDSLVVAGLLLATAGGAFAQTPAPATPQHEGWKFTVYPILAWVPLDIGIDVHLPPIDIGGGITLPGGGGKVGDTRFDGAFLGGVTASNGTWRIDTDGVWAAVAGDRTDVPKLTADVDVIYFHASGGRKIYKDVFVTAGVRRLALKYDIRVADLANYTRKPGLWDPLIGLGYHHVGEKFEVHGIFEGGGFGVGADTDIGATLRADWKPTKHFGLTGGYSLLYFKFSHDVANRTFSATQLLHGPVAGIGLYF